MENKWELWVINGSIDGAKVNTGFFLSQQLLFDGNATKVASSQFMPHSYACRYARTHTLFVYAVAKHAMLVFYTQKKGETCKRLRYVVVQ